ncbi:MAG: hypothetical protein KKB20_11410 [Proteobacteria bacterium]|nr:hypothetical protein [Pseudomonadota bacterium]
MDIKTLVVCNAVVPAFLFLALLFFRSFQKTYPGFGSWTAATLVIALGYILWLSRESMPLWLNIIVMNGLFAWGAVLRLAGVVRFMSGRRLAAIWYWALFFCITALLFFYLILDVIALRTFIISFILFVGTCRCALEVFRFAPRSSRPLYFATGGIYLLSGLVIMSRAAGVLMAGRYQMFDPGAVYVVYFLMMMVFELLWGLSFLMMNSQRLESELRDSGKSLVATVGDLEKTLAEVRTLRGFIPICSNCKKIRDDTGYWQQVEKYISDHSDAQFSHGLCPECVRKLYPQYADRILDQPSAK